MKFELEPYNRNKPDEELIDDLKRVAKELDKDKITREEYTKFGKYHSTTLEKRFGGWSKTLKKAGLQETLATNVSNEELFKNIENVWIRLGKQPRREDMNTSESKFTGSVYENRFTTWKKLLKIL